jgi:DegV family protein with EDD domain
VARAHLYIAVGTLEYLYRGGRIGRASQLLGTALNIKPILQFSGGVVQPVTRVRSMRRAVDTMLDLVAGTVEVGARARMAVFHIGAPDEAARFKLRLLNQFQPLEMVETECSPVLGAHAGPGTIGVAYYEETGEMEADDGKRKTD